MQRNCITCPKQFQKSHKEQRNAYEKRKRKADFYFKLVCNIGNRTRQAFKSQNVKKSNKTLELLGRSNSFFT